MVRLQQFGTAVLPGTLTAQAVTSTEAPLASFGCAHTNTASLVPRFGPSENGAIVGAATVCGGPPLTFTVTVMFSAPRIGRAVTDAMFVIQTARLFDVWVDLMVQVVFGHANTASGPGGSTFTPQLFAGTESPTWFTHADTVMSSPRCNAVVPCVHVSAKFACLWAASDTVLAATEYSDAGTGTLLR